MTSSGTSSASSSEDERRRLQEKTESFPLGYENNNPVIVCLDRDHRRQVWLAFNLRAHYILPLERLNGRRYNKAIVFQKPFMSEEEGHRFKRWLHENVWTHLSPEGELIYV